MSRHLRLGLLVDTGPLSGWQADAISRVVALEGARFVAVVRNASSPPRRRIWRRVPWNTIDRLERAVADRRYGEHPRLVDAPVPLDSVLPGVPVIDVDPVVSASGLVQRFAPESLEILRNLDLDVLVRMGFNILRGEVLRVPEYGIWSFHHGDNRVFRGEPPGFWEVANGTAQSGVVLQVLSEELDNGRVIRRAAYNTVTGSWNQNRRTLYGKSTVLLADAMSELISTGGVRTVGDVRPVALFDQPLMRAPGAAQLMTTGAKLAVRLASQRRPGRAIDRWELVVARQLRYGFALRRAQAVPAPPGRYWADPFLIEHEGRHWVFFEDFDLPSNRGHIAAGELTPEGLRDVRPVLDPGTHLSYPFLLRHGGRLFMIPESADQEHVRAWECESFPDRWRPGPVLLDGVKAYDTTLVEHTGRWWMFTGIQRSPWSDPGDELHVYSADHPLSTNWTAHPRNPVVADAGTARMAGPLFHHDGRLYRPSQAAGQVYGSGLQFARIDRLTVNDYRETLVERVQPKWEPDLVGIHHFSRLGDTAVLDACRRRRSR
jgi:hypothetical protein